MFFVVSKVLWFVAEPANFLVLLALLGLLLVLFRVRRGRAVTYGAVAALAICCFSPLGALLLRPIEDRFPQPPDDMPAPAAIIVLGGGLDKSLTLARKQTALLAAGSRLTAGVELARRYPQAKLVFTGGSADLRGRGPGEAAGVREFWLALGVPPERMLFEEKSRNTWENATMTRDLLKPDPQGTYLLVTSAWHMPRSVGIFRQVGFNVTPYPADYRTYGDARDWRPDSEVTHQLTKLNYALHEWIGLIAYRLTGKSEAFFPAPR